MSIIVRPMHRHYVGWRLRRIRLLRQWPVLIWAAACLLAISLYYSLPPQSSAAAIRGMIEAEGIALAAIESSRIKTIHVREGQEVRQGDLLVEMDPSLIEHEVAVDLLDAIRIETAFGDTHQDVLQAINQRLDTIASIEAAMAECRQDWSREAAELEALRADQLKRQELHKSRVIDDLTSIELLPSIADLEKAVALYPERIALYEKQLAAARTYYDSIMGWLGSSDAPSVSDAIGRHLKETDVQALLKRATAAALLKTESYKILAPRAGTISQIYHEAGEMVDSTLPILRLAASKPDRVTALMEGPQVGRVLVGQKMLVRSLNRRSLPGSMATVESISADLHAAASTLSATGRLAPLQAQVVRLRLELPHPFIGGEAVILRDASRSRIGRMLDRFIAMFQSHSAASKGA